MHLRSSLGKLLITAALLLAGAGAKAQYATGDLVSNATGAWGVPATWKIYNGVSVASSPFAGAMPNANNTVWIRSGHTITAVYGTVYACANLTVEAGGKLYNNDLVANNLSYIGIYDSYLNNYGEIGNGAIYDGISFNIEGANVTISGTGPFNACRLNKRGNFHVMTAASQVNTNLIINTNINLRFAGTALFNYGDFISAGGSTFNVTIGAGYTVALLGGGGSVAIDGSAGADAKALRGAFVINGTLTIPATLYLTTNNAAGNGCSFTIGSGGTVVTNTVNAAASGAGTHALFIASGGTLEIAGTPTAWSAFSGTNNTYTGIDINSMIIYSGMGNQDVRGTPILYGHLRIRGTGTKTMMAAISVRGNLEIQNATGTPVLDVSASLFTLSVGGNWTNYAQTGFNERNATAVVNFNGTTGPQSITTTGGEQFNTWRFSKTVAQPLVVMNSNVQVAANVELNTAILDLNGNQLTVLNPATTAIGSLFPFSTQRHIRSERTDNLSRVRWDIGGTLGAHLVPFGTTAAYTPFTFNLVSGNAGSVTMATYGTAADNLPWPVTPTPVTNLASSIGLLPDNRDATVDRFWQVDVTGPNPVAGLGFTYAASELPLVPYNDPFSMKAQRWNSASQQWEVQIEGNSAAYSATTDVVVSAFGPFTLSPVLSPLPIELVAFDAKPEGEMVRLEWTTASERDNAYFTILRSADGAAYEELFLIDGAGVSNVPLHYTDVDRAPLMGTSYYKLRQTDTDGRSTESDAVAVKFIAGAELSAYPNPVTDMLHVSGLSGIEELRVMDATGRTALRATPSDVSDRYTLPVSGLPPGVYVLSVHGSGGVRTLHFVRQ